MHHSIQWLARRWFECGSQSISNGYEPYLHDLFIRDAQYARGFAFKGKMEGGENRSQATRPRCQHKAPDRGPDSAPVASLLNSGQIDGSTLDTGNNKDGNLVQMFGQISCRRKALGQFRCFFLIGSGSDGLFEHVLLPTRGVRAFAIESCQGFPLGGISDNNKVPVLHTAWCWSLYSEGQACADHLWLYRAREVQAPADCAGCAQYFINGKVEGRHGALPFSCRLSI